MPLELGPITVTSETHFHCHSAPKAHKQKKTLTESATENYCLDSHFLQFPFNTVGLAGFFAGPALMVG